MGLSSLQEHGLADLVLLPSLVLLDVGWITQCSIAIAIREQYGYWYMLMTLSLLAVIFVESLI